MASNRRGQPFSVYARTLGIESEPLAGLEARPGRGFPRTCRARSAAVALPGGARESLGKLRAVLRNLGLSRNNISPARLFGARGQAARDLQVRKGC